MRARVRVDVCFWVVLVFILVAVPSSSLKSSQSQAVLPTQASRSHHKSPARDRSPSPLRVYATSLHRSPSPSRSYLKPTSTSASKFQSYQQQSQGLTRSASADPKHFLPAVTSPVNVKTRHHPHQARTRASTSLSIIKNPLRTQNFFRDIPHR